MKTDACAPRGGLDRLAGERGITLLETLFSLSLFALSVATMSNFIVTQIRSSNTNDNYTIAYELAVEEFENVRAQLYDQMESRTREYEVGGMTFEVETNVEPQRLPNGDMVTVLTVKDTMCKWPIGDPADATFGFCGHASAEGSPYCPEHARVAFQPAKKRERRAREFDYIQRLAG